MREGIVTSSSLKLANLRLINVGGSCFSMEPFQSSIPGAICGYTKLLLTDDLIIHCIHLNQAFLCRFHPNTHLNPRHAISSINQPAARRTFLASKWHGTPHAHSLNIEIFKFEFRPTDLHVSGYGLHLAWREWHTVPGCSRREDDGDEGQRLRAVGHVDLDSARCGQSGKSGVVRTYGLVLRKEKVCMRRLGRSKP
jgi:hypothetical protein